MKKCLIASSVALLAACSSSPKVNTENLSGNWVCKMEYHHIDTATLDFYRMNTDGTFTNQGYISTPIKQSLFRYSTQQRGQWQVKGDKLVYTIQQNQVERHHKPKMAALLQSKKKADQDIIKLEAGIFAVFSKNSTPETIELTVSDLKPHSYKVTQIMSPNEIYVGHCLSEAEMKNRLNALTPNANQVADNMLSESFK